MSDLSQALKEAYARSDSETRHLIAVELQHNVFPGGALRIVNHDTDITISSDIYVAHAMQAKEPELGSEPDNKIKIRIDGTPGTFQYWIAAAIDTASPVYADIRPFAFNMRTEAVIDVVGTYSFLVTKAEYDMTACVLTLGHVSPTNVPFPGKKYDPITYPALFK